MSELQFKVIAELLGIIANCLARQTFGKPRNEKIVTDRVNELVLAAQGAQDNE